MTVTLIPVFKTKMNSTTINNQDNNEAGSKGQQQNYNEFVSDSDSLCSFPPSPNREETLRKYFSILRNKVKKKEKERTKSRDDYEVQEMLSEARAIQSRLDVIMNPPPTPKKTKRKRTRSGATPQMFGLEILPTADKDYLDSLVDKVEEVTEKVIERLPNKQDYESFNSNLKSLSDLAVKFSETDVKEDVKEILDSLRHTAKDSVSEAKSAFSSSVCELASIAVFIGASINCIQKRTKGSFYFASATCLGMVYFVPKLKNSVELLLPLGSIATFATMDDMKKSGAVPEMSEDNVESVILGLTTLAAGYVSVVSGRNVPVELFKNIGQVARMKSTLSDLINLVVKTFEKVINHVRDSCFDLPSLRFLTAKNNSIEGVLKDAEEIKELHRKDRLVASEYPIARLKVLLIEAKKMAKDTPKDKYSEGSLRILYDEIRTLEKIQAGLISNAISARGTRMEPVGVLLKGGPGAGKSVIMEHIYTAFLAKILPTYDYEEFIRAPQQYVFNRQFENKYFDGHGARTVVMLFDDFAQAKDIAGSPDNEIMNIIRVINGFEMKLHMAALEQKSNSVATEKLVIASTNMELFQCNSIHSVEALQRRFAIQAVVCPKIEYSKDGDVKNPMARRIDKLKLPNVQIHDLTTEYKPGPVQVTSLSPKILEFHMCDGAGKLTGEIIDFDEIMIRILEKYRLNHAWFENQKIEFAQSRTRYRDESGIDTRPPLPSFPPGLNGVEGSLPVKDLTIVPQLWDENDQDSNPGDEAIGMTEVYNTGFTETYGTQIDMSTVDLPEHLSIQKARDRLRKDKAQYEVHILTEISIDEQLSTFDEHIVTLAKWIFKSLPFDDDKLYNLAYCYYDRDLQDVSPIPVIIANLIQDLGDSFITAVENEDLCSFRSVIMSRSMKGEYHFPQIQIMTQECQGPNRFVQYTIALKATLLDYLRVANEGLWAMLNWFHNKPWWFKFATGSGLTVIVTLICKGWSALTGQVIKESEIDEVTPESKGWGERGGQKSTKKFVSPKEVREKSLQAAPQGGSDVDQSGYELIRKLVRTNAYSISFQRDNTEDKYTPMGFGFFVKARILLMPYHFILKMREAVEEDATVYDNKIKFNKSYSTKPCHEYIVTVRDVLSSVFGDLLHTKDACLVAFGESDFQPHVDRIKNFITNKDLQTMRNINLPIMMPLPRFEGETVITKARTFDEPVMIESAYTGEYYVRQTLMYDGFTGPGDCGALCCILNASVPIKKIAGIHIAGHSGRGKAFSTIITQEDLLEELKSMPDKFTTAFSCEDFDSMIVRPQIGNILAEGQFNEFGYLKKAPVRATSTKLRPSALQNTYAECVVAPALLYKVGDIDPMQLALRKYCRPNQEELRTHRVRRAVDWATENYIEHLDKAYSSNRIEPKVHSLREAVYGIEGNPRVNGIPHDTSSGYPMNCSGVQDLKVGLFPEETGMKNFLALEEMVNEYLGKLILGIRPVMPFTDFLKDEPRPPGKTARLVSGAPIVGTAAVKMYFGSFIEQQQLTMIENGSAIGINGYSSDWHTLAQTLCRFGKADELAFGAGDFSAFDASERLTIHQKILDIIEIFYAPTATPDDVQIRKGLWLEVTNPRHICDGLLYEMSGSLSSGHALTPTVNSMYNNISFRASWNLLDLKENFNKYVMVVVFGDDNIFSVHYKYRHLFNEMTIGAAMAKLGLTYTTELKVEATVPLRKLTDCEFLKRTFRFCKEEGIFVAPLRLQVCLNIPQWTKKAGGEAIVADNVVNAMRELSLHPREVFNYWVPRIKEQFEKYYPDLETNMSLATSYNSVQAEVLNTIDMW